jgi:lauroyl/myristoyl acyltransferase
VDNDQLDPAVAQIRIVDRKPAPPERALVERADLTLCALLPVYAVLSWLRPEERWAPLIRSTFVSIDEKGPLDTMVRGIEASGLAPELSISAGTAASILNAHRLESYFQYLRDYRPGGWKAKTRIDNEGLLAEIVGSGRGAVLWVGHFVYNGLPLKKGMHEAGYEVFHLSRPEHGFSTTRFGMRVLNPIRSTIEERYLAKRIIIERGAEHKAVREAHRLLKQGKTISITAGHWEGRQLAFAPIGEGFLPMSTGAPSLAHATGAALLPIFIVREEGVFRIIVGEEIGMAKNSRDNAVREAVAKFAALLRRYAVAYPDQWRGWKYLKRANSVQ